MISEHLFLRLSPKVSSEHVMWDLQEGNNSGSIFKGHACGVKIMFYKLILFEGYSQRYIYRIFQEVKMLYNPRRHKKLF